MVFFLVLESCILCIIFSVLLSCFVVVPVLRRRQIVKIGFQLSLSLSRLFVEISLNEKIMGFHQQETLISNMLHYTCTSVIFKPEKTRIVNHGFNSLKPDTLANRGPFFSSVVYRFFFFSLFLLQLVLLSVLPALFPCNKECLLRLEITTVDMLHRNTKKIYS